MLHPPVFVYCEQPSGRFNKPTLSYMAGAVMAGIYDGVFDHWHRPVEISTATSGQWKKHVVAADGHAKNGTFGKPKKDEDPATYPALIWAKANGYEGDDDNEADAMCMTELARRDVAFK